MFARIIGNENVKDVLRRLLASGRVPNSMLFAGQDGIGKSLFALELARAFICHTLKGVEACGECSACVRVDSFVIPQPTDKNKDDFKKVFFGGHGDVGKIVAYKRTILVDAIRNLEREAFFRPYEASGRFFIIEDADKMNDEAANALLKMLEEPPPTSHIILVTSRPDSLLQTIRSRCQTIRFAPIETKKVRSFLHNNKSFSEDDARLAAATASGSIGRALLVDVEEFRGRRQTMMMILEKSIKRNRAELLIAAEKMNDASNKDGYENCLDILLGLIRDAWAIRVAKTEETIVNLDIAARLSNLTQNVEPQRLSRWISQIEQMREGFAVNINRKAATDALFMEMAAG